jgi:hypothetical protein
VAFSDALVGRSTVVVMCDSSFCSFVGSGVPDPCEAASGGIRPRWPGALAHVIRPPSDGTPAASSAHER